jgi:hypothetical protein
LKRIRVWVCKSIGDVIFYAEFLAIITYDARAKPGVALINVISSLAIATALNLPCHMPPPR